MGPSILRRLSLEQKLPLVIGGLLAAAIVAISAAAYVEVRRTSQHLAAERLQSVTLQIRDLLTQNRSQLLSQASLTASRPAVVNFARTRAPALRERALAELEATTLPLIVASELRDTAALLQTAAIPAGFAVPSPRDLVHDGPDAPPAIIGPLRAWGDTVVYPIAAPVPGAAGAWVVHWRRQASSTRARELITELIGDDVSLYVGNADGTLWTDLENPIPALPLHLADSSAAQSYVHPSDGTRHLAATAPLPGMPWVVAVSMPFHNVVAPATIFAQRILLIALIAIALALGITWVVSRHITDPLRQLTVAAGAIAAGDYTRPVNISRADELGQLGTAFVTMATQLGELHADLERRIEQRTAALNATLQELQETQDALVRREKLAMLGQLASGVGHELRNPLGVMTNAVYYLKTVLANPPKNVAEYLDIVQQQITLSEKIVGDLLDFARSKPPQRQPTALGEVVRAQIQRLVPPDSVSVETDVPADLPPVLADPVQVGQIVFNLLVNAVQAIEESGNITIRAQAAGESVQLDVADSGPGVPAELRDRIFEPLFTTKARGIGLGLAVSRTLARANGGDLTVQNVPGPGAAFRLELPVPAAVPA